MQQQQHAPRTATTSYILRVQQLLHTQDDDEVDFMRRPSDSQYLGADGTLVQTRLHQGTAYPRVHGVVLTGCRDRGGCSPSECTGERLRGREVVAADIY